MPADRKPIMIIDDDQAIRDALSLALKIAGYRVVSATNGKEGLEKLREDLHPCMIFLDLMMPVMDGWGFIDAYEKDERLPRVPIVVISSFNTESRAVRADTILNKPVDLGRMFQLTRQYCG